MGSLLQYRVVCRSSNNDAGRIEVIVQGPTFGPECYDKFRDPEKLEKNVQYEAQIYEDFSGGLYMITEEFPPLQPEET